MSKTKKVKSIKDGKKSPDKKTIKKVTKPSPKKKNAAKTSKPANAKRAKTVAISARPDKKKMSSGGGNTAGKPIKKAPVKASKAKSTVKATSKTIKAKNVIVKKPTPIKQIAAKKVDGKKAKGAVSTSSATKVSTTSAVKKGASTLPKNSTSSSPKPILSTPIVKKETPAQLEKAKKAEELNTKKQLAEKKSNEVLAITNTIPVKAKNEISLSKIASISHSITNPIKKTDSYAIKPEKEPSGKFELEFVVHSSSEMLYEFLSTPSGLSEWFCDDLNIRNGIYTFIWDDQLQQARLLKTVDLQLVRFQWVDKTDGSYFEFKIQRDDLTNDISLIITDFAESVGDRESSKLLWHSQIEKLMHVIGSIF